MSEKSRLLDIDRARGLAIFLVVLGHLVAGTPPAGNDWYITLEKVIYRFHMPFFMYLSGFIMYFTYRGVHDTRSYFRYAWSKFARLAPGFFFFGILILAGKLLLSRYLHVDDVPVSFIDGLVEILILPGHSAAGSLWFIYVLMIFYLVFPVLLALSGGRLSVILALGVIVHFLPATPYFMLDDVFQYLLYFTIGAIVSANYQQFVKILDRYAWLLLLVFVLSYLTLYFDLSKANSKLIIGLCSIPAVHALVRLRPFNGWNFLVGWGTLSYAIYLLNTLAIGVTKGVLLKFVSWDGSNFLWIAPILLIAGLYGSIFAKRVIFPYIKPLDRITN